MRKAVRAPVAAPEHELEPAYGLPETLPEGERLLWQGQPDAALVARRVFHLHWVAGYFAVMLAWQLISALHDGTPWAEALRASLPLLLLSAVGLGILAVLARLTARTAVYTLTDRRVVMRIGIVLTVTYNLPLRCLDGAHLARLDGRAGELALALQGDTRIAYLHLWPHARPWHLARPQPMLRCLADAQAVAEQLSRAWSAANAQDVAPVPPLPAPLNDAPQASGSGAEVHDRPRGGPAAGRGASPLTHGPLTA